MLKYFLFNFFFIASMCVYWNSAKHFDECPIDSCSCKKYNVHISNKHERCHYWCDGTPGSYECKCSQGYTLDQAGVCIDVDECQEGLHTCDQTCVNKIGGYRCECKFGYSLQEDGKTCKLMDKNFIECGKGISLQSILSTTTDAKNVQPWPWQVGVYQDGYFSCSGTLISDRWILTTAHCIHYPNNNKHYTIKTGDHYKLFRRNNKNNVQTYHVDKIEIHHKYDGTNLLDNDIALIRVKGKIPIDNKNGGVSIACLPQQSDEPTAADEKCFARGLGKVKDTKYFNQDVAQIPFTVAPHSACAKQHNFQFSAQKQQQTMCALRSGKDFFCWYESGTPLVCVGKQGELSVRGFVNWADRGCKKTYTIFGQVSHYLKWIHDHVSNE